MYEETKKEQKMKQKRVQRETNKTKLPSECQQETNEKKRK